MDINLSGKKSSNRDQVQEKLTYLISKEISTFLKSPDIILIGLDGNTEVDIMAGALITLVTKNIAYSAANEPTFDSEAYLNTIFDAMRLLFIKQHRIFKEDMERIGKIGNTDGKFIPGIH